MAKVSPSRKIAKPLNPQIFKAYDVRGKYPSEINETGAFEIAFALGKFFKKGKIVVGHDARIGSPTLYRTVIKGLNHSNIQKNVRVIRGGLMTTPMLYFLVNKLGCRGGIMVTASHNPKEYNGLKVVKEKAKMVSGKDVWNLLNHG